MCSQGRGGVGGLKRTPFQPPSFIILIYLLLQCCKVCHFQMQTSRIKALSAGRANIVGVCLSFRSVTGLPPHRFVAMGWSRNLSWTPRGKANMQSLRQLTCQVWRWAFTVSLSNSLFKTPAIYRWKSRFPLNNHFISSNSSPYCQFFSLSRGDFKAIPCPFQISRLLLPLAECQ